MVFARARASYRSDSERDVRRLISFTCKEHPMTTLTIKSDVQTKADVLNEFKWDTRLSGTDIGVQVREGIVTLVGTVNVFAKKFAAREAAHRVRGVLDVVDELHVKTPNMGGRTDVDIARAARTALEWDAFVPNEQSTSTVFWLSLRQLVRDQRSCLSVPAPIRMNCCDASRSISRQCCPPMRQCSRESLRCFPSLRSMWVRSVA